MGSWKLEACLEHNGDMLCGRIGEGCFIFRRTLLSEPRDGNGFVDSGSWKDILGPDGLGW